MSRLTKTHWRSNRCPGHKSALWVLATLLAVNMVCPNVASLAVAKVSLPGKVSAPPIVTGAQWGSKPRPIPDSRKQVPVWITIHHAGEIWKAGQDPAQFVRNMQIFGQNRPFKEKPPRNTYWPDLPYHFLIAPDGRIFEGRPIQYEPESNTKYPLKGNICVEMMGDFNVQRPSVAQLRSCVHLTAWLRDKYHIDNAHVRTHEDAAPGQTDCPGKDFYRYFLDGQFKRWVNASMDGHSPEVIPGPALKGGPDRPI